MLSTLKQKKNTCSQKCFFPIDKIKIENFFAGHYFNTNDLVEEMNQRYSASQKSNFLNILESSFKISDLSSGGDANMTYEITKNEDEIELDDDSDEAEEDKKDKVSKRLE